jgi:hypothetical protein
MQKELGESRGDQASLFSLINLRAGTIEDILRESGLMRETLKIYLSKWHLDDTAAARSLQFPVQDTANLAKMVSGRQPGFSYVYEEESRMGRFIACDGSTMLGFNVVGVTRQEVASIADECKRIALWDINEFRKAADRALGTSTSV